MDILRWGDEAEVIGPGELRETMTGTISRMEER